LIASFKRELLLKLRKDVEKIMHLFLENTVSPLFFLEKKHWRGVREKREKQI
jgi:predicted DNA-binding protein (MmcQ/YjbR family)